MGIGTNRDKTLNTQQREILKAKEQLGWSYKTLADVLYGALHDDETDELENSARFESTLKKQLSRPSTPVELLETYVRLIHQHPDYQKAVGVKLKPIDLGFIDKTMQLELSKIAKQLCLDDDD